MFVNAKTQRLADTKKARSNFVPMCLCVLGVCMDERGCLGFSYSRFRFVVDVKEGSESGKV
jgi:hypothetical protein